MKNQIIVILLHRGIPITDIMFSKVIDKTKTLSHIRSGYGETNF